MNTPGSYRCSCKEGYEVGNGGSHCIGKMIFSFISFFIKSFENIASNTIGGSRCECTTGYKLNVAGDACVGEKLGTRDEKLLYALH